MSLDIGVASVEAGAEPSPVAPTETGGSDVSLNTSGSNSAGTAPSTTPTDGQQVSPNEFLENLIKKPEESAGIKNLRTHADTLKKDLDALRQETTKYRATHDEVEKFGGLDTVKGLAEFHNGFVGADRETYRSEGVYGTLNSLYDSNPGNYTVLVETIAEQHPEIVKQVLAKHDPEYQQLMGLKSQYAPDDEPLTIPDDELDPDNPLHKEVLESRREKAQREAEKQQQAQAQAQQMQQEAIGTVNRNIFGDADKQLSQLRQTLKLDDAAYEKIEKEFFLQCQLEESFQDNVAQLYNSALAGGKPPIGTEKALKDIINSSLANVINRHTQTQRATAQAQQPQQKQQPSRVHVNSNTSSIGIPTPEQIDLNNEDQQRSVISSLLKAYTPRVR